MSKKEREGSTKGKGGLYKKLQIPTLPLKFLLSLQSGQGVGFHLHLKAHLHISLILQFVLGMKSIIFGN